MTKTFTTFKKFSDENRARELKRFLNENKINSFLTDNISSLGSNFSNSLLHEFKVKIKSTDYESALMLYEERIERMLREVEGDHYLFSYTDKELYEILLGSEDGSEFEYRLSKRLLQERGKSVDGEFLESLRKKKEQTIWKNLNAIRKQGALWTFWPF